MGNLGDFTKATPSVGALTTGLALEVVQSITQLESYNYQVKSDILKSEGEAAQASGTAIKDAMSKEADSMTYNAYSSIGLGAMQIGGEVASIGWGKAPTTINKQIDATTKELGNVDSWDEAIKNVASNNEAKEMVVQDGAQQAAKSSADVNRNLKQVNVRKQAFEEGKNQSDLEFAEKTNLNSFDELKDDVRRQQKAVQKQKTTLETRKESIQSRITQVSQMAGYVLQGGLQVKAAGLKAEEAEIQCLSKQADYALNVTQMTVNNNNSLGDGMEGNKQAAVQALLAGIARANEIQG